MHSLEKVLTVINSRSNAQTISVAPQVIAWSAARQDIPISDFVTNGKVMAECLLSCYQQFDYDMILVGADNSLEAETLGVQLAYPRDNYPYVKLHLLKENMAALKLPKQGSDGRMSEVLNAAAIVRHQVDDKAALIGKVTGPMTVATQLLGLDQLLYFSMDDIRQFERLLDFCTQISLEWGMRLLSTGMHGIVLVEPVASQAVVPPAFFSELILPRLKEIFRNLKDMGALIRWLHITGPIQEILRQFHILEANLVGLDYENSLIEALQVYPTGRFIGNIKPFTFVSGSPKEILARASDLLNQAEGKLILSSGCELPLTAKSELVTSLMQLSHK